MTDVSGVFTIVVGSYNKISVSEAPYIVAYAFFPISEGGFISSLPITFAMRESSVLIYGSQWSRP